MIVQWRMEGKSLPNVSSIDRRPMRYACWSYSWSLYRCSTVNMLVLRRIAGCFRDRIETIFCRALSSRIPIKDIASSAPHDVSGDITVLVSLHPQCLDYHYVYLLGLPNIIISREKTV